MTTRHSKEADIDLEKEFDRQLGNLLERGYPRISGVSSAEFARPIDRLRGRLRDFVVSRRDGQEAGIPFVIVIAKDRIASDKAISLVEVNGKRGFTTMEAGDLERFRPIESVELPNTSSYLLMDVDTGIGTRNVTPVEALRGIQSANRSPLTIDEGIAITTHYPAVLGRNNGFSLLGSRCGDRRVAALWMSGGKPRLGWCWAGNSHTWLGSASAEGRVGF